MSFPLTFFAITQHVAHLQHSLWHPNCFFAMGRRQKVCGIKAPLRIRKLGFLQIHLDRRTAIFPVNIFIVKKAEQHKHHSKYLYIILEHYS